MMHVRTPAPPPLTRAAARLSLVAGEFLAAVVIIVGGGWLTALASLR